MILVTGAAGLLGREVVRQLVEHGVPVRGLDLAWPPGPVPPCVQRQTGDLRDPAVCRAAVEAVDGVVHAAAVQFHTPGCPRSRLEPYFRRNVDVTRALLEAAIAAGVPRFVFVSSAMVYGLPRSSPVREDAPTCPLGPYGRSKLACEAICREAQGRIAHVTVLRPCAIVGPGRLGLLQRLFDRVRQHRPVVIFGDVAHRHQMVAVGDLAAACRLALRSPGHGTFNVGSTDPPTVRGLLESLCRAAGSRSRVVTVPAGPARWAFRLLWSARLSPLRPEQFLIAPEDYVLDTSAARERLGFAPCDRDVDSLIANYRWYVGSLGT